MAKVTVKKEQNFTVISNDIFKDTRLSFKAKGLLTTMLSCPLNWNYTIEGLSKISKDGKASIRTALAELEECGYLERKQLRNEKGAFVDLEYIVYENPKTDLPMSENRITENPISENCTQLNTNISSTNELNTDLLKADGLNNNAFSEDKSSSKGNMYASSPEEKEVSGTQKQNRFIPADYSYEQLREHIRPVYESVLKDVYGSTDDDTPLESMLDITEAFYRLYEQEIGVKHRVLSDKSYMSLVDSFMNPPEIMSDDYMFNYEAYMDMAKLYFKTDYNRQGKYKGNIKKSISHFMADVIRENLFYRACYWGEDE